MPPRASKRAIKPSPKAKNASATSKPEAVPLDIIEEVKIPAPEFVTEPVEESKVQGTAESNAGEEKEILATKVQDVEGPPQSDDVENIVTKEEVSVTMVDVVEETKTIEDADEENHLDAEKDGDVVGEEDPVELNGGEVEDNGAKQNGEETEGVENWNGTANPNESGKEGGGDKSGKDDEDKEEDEDPSAYLQAPFTDRKKEECEIFVGRLGKDVVEDDLIKVFGEFGEIQAARIVKHPTTQKCKGYAFIRYATVEQTKKVLADLKDGTEVRGKLVRISKSQDNNTLYICNICKTWTKEHVLEKLKSFGIEQIEEMHLPDDPNNEGNSKGFCFLEFSTHSDAMSAYKRLRKPDAIFGCDRSAKVAFTQSSVDPSEEALSQVKTVFVEGLADSWNEEKVKEICKQYGEIERVYLSRNSKKKRKDLGFITFTSRESAISCVEGINNFQSGEEHIKVKAELAKLPQKKGRLANQPARGGYRVKKEGEKAGEVPGEAGPSNLKGNAKSKRPDGKKADPKLRGAKGGKPYKSQTSVAGDQGAGAPSGPRRTNRQRKEQPVKGGKRGRRDIDSSYSGQQSKKPRGNKHGSPASGFGNRRNNSFLKNTRQNYGAVSGPSSRYQGRDYGAVSGSKRHHSDMEPHAGYLKPATAKEGRISYGHGPRRAVGYSSQVSSAAAYGGGSALQPSYAPAYSSYAGYEGGSSGSAHGYPGRGYY